MMRKQAELARILVAQNGVRWTLAYVLSHALKTLLGHLERWLDAFETRHGLPRLSGAAINRRIWESYDWSNGGEEWTPSAEWKRSLVALIEERVAPGAIVLEIGPGAGRWMETLQQRAGTLTLVDVSAASIEACRKRFAGCQNVRYLVNDGRALHGVDDESIDFIWSFDVFVHVSPEDAGSYAAEFRRVLRRGGRGMAHHSAIVGLRGGFRSRMTDELFARILRDAGLAIREQFDPWGPDG